MEAGLARRKVSRRKKGAAFEMTSRASHWMEAAGGTSVQGDARGRGPTREQRMALAGRSSRG